MKKMKKWQKIVIWTIATPPVLAGLLLLIYVLVNIQGVIEPFQHGDPGADRRILIASQGSEFKESLTGELIDNIEADSIFISIIDVTNLDSIDASEWDAIVIVHTMQIHKMPKQAMRFLGDMSDLGKVTLVSTSGAGDENVDYFDVDGIATPSRKYVIPQIVKYVMPRVEERISVASGHSPPGAADAVSKF